MIEFMVDLETMGIGPNAAIVAIGAVAMDTGKPTLTGEEFYEVVSLQSSVDAGLAIDPSTVLWWLGQSDEARKELYGRRSIPLYDALSNFSFWVAKNCPVKSARCIWGNGAAFDNVILASAYKAVGRDQPWTYSGDRCYRTMRQLHPAIEGPESSGVAHNALADAKWQAEHLMLILKGVREVGGYQARLCRTYEEQDRVREKWANRAAQVEDIGWRPIEEAPIGGGADSITDPNWVDPPRILLSFQDGDVRVGYYEWYFSAGGYGCNGMSAWVDLSTGEQLENLYGEPPTHWMPLPRPPVKK